MCIAPRRPGIKIRISKFEISNKLQYSNPKIEIQNGMIGNFISFWSFGFVSIFGFRVSNLYLQLYLACFASLRLAPWNTDSTEIQFFDRSDIPQGESSFPGFRNRKFNGKFQKSWRSFSLPPVLYGAFVLVGETHRELW